MTMNLARVLLYLASLVLGGCSTTYFYHGTLRTKDNAGVERNLVVSWQRTDSAIHSNRGESGGAPIRLRTQCSATVLVYEETKEGIRLRNLQQNYRSFDKPGHSPENCGEVVGYKRVNSITEGPLTLTFQCAPLNFQSEGIPVGRIEPYRFQIKEQKLKDQEGEPSLEELLSCKP